MYIVHVYPNNANAKKRLTWRRVYCESIDYLSAVFWYDDHVRWGSHEKVASHKSSGSEGGHVVVGRVLTPARVLPENKCMHACIHGGRAGGYRLKLPISIS